MHIGKKKEEIPADRAYRRLKKTGQPVFRFPQELSKATGIVHMGLDGLSCGSGKDGYSAVYHIRGPVSDCGAFTRGLREKDFHAEAYRKKAGDTDCVLALYSHADRMESAQEEMKIMEQELGSLLKDCHASAMRMDFQERMRYIHECLSFGFCSRRTAVEDYLKETATWAGDFDTDRQYGKQEGAALDLAARDGVYYRVCFIRKFNGHSADLCDVLRSHDNIRYIKTCLQPVSDLAAAIQFDRTYLDADVMRSRLSRRKDALSKVLDLGRGAEKENTRYFCLGSLMFLLRGVSAEELKNEYEAIAYELILQGFRLEYYFGAMPFAVRALAAGNFPEMNPLRLQESSRMGYFLL